MTDVEATNIPSALVDDTPIEASALESAANGHLTPPPAETIGERALNRVAVEIVPLTTRHGNNSV